MLKSSQKVKQMDNKQNWVRLWDVRETSFTTFDSLLAQILAYFGFKKKLYKEIPKFFVFLNICSTLFQDISERTIEYDWHNFTFDSFLARILANFGFKKYIYKEMPEICYTWFTLVSLFLIPLVGDHCHRLFIFNPIKI